MTSTGPRRAAIYLRVSSEDQAREGTSLGTQRATLEQYVEAQGWVLAGAYEDAGVSGAKASRPALNTMLDDVTAGLIDVVVVTKWDRLGRSLNHQTTLWGVLDELGVEYVSAGQPESSGVKGRLVRNIMASIAEEERFTIRERTTNGRTARLLQGGWTGGDAPYGFRVDRTGGKAVLALDDAEAGVIRYAVSMLLDQGMGPLAVVHALNGEGYRPRKAQAWTLTLLRSHLVRGPWGGTWTYAKDSARRAGRDLIPDAITVAIPPLLEPERHAALLAHLKRTSTPKANAPVHPLSGLLFGSCGHPFHGVSRRDRGNRRYRCRYGKDVGRGWTCPEPTILADLMDEATWAQVYRVLADPDALRAAATDRLDLLAMTGDTVAEALGRAKLEVGRVEQALANAFTGALKAGLDEDTLNLALGSLRADLATARARVADLAGLQADEATMAGRMGQVQALADYALDALRDPTPEQMAQVFRMLDVKIRMVETTPGGSPVQWYAIGAMEHDSLLAALQMGAPTRGGVLSLANRTSR